MNTQNTPPISGRAARAWSGLKCLLLGAVLLTGSLGLTTGAVQAAPDVISTIAGGGTDAPGNGKAATSVALASPFGLAFDSQGGFFFAENGANLVRKVDSNGVITTVAGTGTAGFSGDGGPAKSAQLDDVSGVAVDGAGNLFICVFGSNRVRVVDTSGIIRTFAGGGTNDSNESGPATSAQLNRPIGVAVDGTGNLFISESNGNRVRKVTKGGTITTVAGGGTNGLGDNGPATAAELNRPVGLAVDSAGNLFIAEAAANRIRRVNTNGIITTVAGTGNAGFNGDNRAATAARINNPYGVAVDSAGNVFIADLNNYRVRKVDGSGVITTVAGTGTTGFSGDGGSPATARISRPVAVAVNSADNLFFSDLDNNRVRAIGPAPPNRAPVATPRNLTTNEDTNLNGTLTGTDADNNPLTFAKNSDPAHGALTVESNGSFSYVPAADFNGSDSFSFVVNDGTVTSKAATVTITVNPVNDAPSFRIGPNQTIEENAGLQYITDFATAISAGPADEDSQQLNFTVKSDMPDLFATPLAIGRGGRLAYRIKDNAAGVITVTVRLKDDGGIANGGFNTSAAQTFTITVNPSPLFLSASISPTSPVTNSLLRATPIVNKIEGVTFNYSWFVNGTLVQKGGRRRFDMSKPGYGDKGDKIDLVITASKPGTSETATKTVVVGNSAPLAFGVRTSVESGVEIVIPMRPTGRPGGRDYDSNSRPLTFRSFGKTKDGTGQFIRAADGSTVFKYTSNAGFVGLETVRFTVSDDEGSVSNVASLKITVTANTASAASSITSDAISNGSAPSGGNS